MNQASMIVALLAFMISVRSIRPSEHDMVFSNGTESISPAMVAFFRGNNPTNSSAGKNSTVPKWGPPEPEIQRQGNKARTIFLVVGAVFGVVGIALLVVVAVIYVIHARKSRSEIRLGTPEAVCRGGARNFPCRDDI